MTTKELSLKDYLGLVFPDQPSDEIAMYCNQLKDANIHQYVDLLNLALVDYPLQDGIKDLEALITKLTSNNFENLKTKLQYVLAYDFLKSWKEIIYHLLENRIHHLTSWDETGRMEEIVREASEKYRVLVGSNNISDVMDRYDLSKLDEMIEQAIKDETIQDIKLLVEDSEERPFYAVFYKYLYDLIKKKNFISITQLVSYLKENNDEHSLKKILIKLQYIKITEHLQRNRCLIWFPCRILAHDLCQRFHSTDIENSLYYE